jgi:nitrate reductase NapE component
MDKLARLRLAEKRIVKYQRRVWLAQVLMWPMIIVGAVVAVGTLVWFLRSRSAGGRHEMPDLPGAHEAGVVDPQANGQASESAR